MSSRIHSLCSWVKLLCTYKFYIFWDLHWKYIPEYICGNSYRTLEKLMLNEENFSSHFSPPSKKGASILRLDKHPERVIGSWPHWNWESRWGKGSNQTTQNPLLQHIEIPTPAMVLNLVPPMYISLLDELCQVKMAKFKDCFKILRKGKFCLYPLIIWGS